MVAGGGEGGSCAVQTAVVGLYTSTDAKRPNGVETASRQDIAVGEEHHLEQEAGGGEGGGGGPDASGRVVELGGCNRELPLLPLTASRQDIAVGEQHHLEQHSGRIDKWRKLWSKCRWLGLYTSVDARNACVVNTASRQGHCHVGEQHHLEIHSAPMARGPVVVQVAVVGLYTSGDAKRPALPLIPPAARMVPLGSSTMLEVLQRAVARGAVVVQVSMVGLCTTVDAKVSEIACPVQVAARKFRTHFWWSYSTPLHVDTHCAPPCCV